MSTDLQITIFGSENGKTLFSQFSISKMTLLGRQKFLITVGFACQYHFVSFSVENNDKHSRANGISSYLNAILNDLE